MRFPKTSILAALLALAAGGVHAAHLQLVDSASTAFGASQTVVNAAGEAPLIFNGTV